MPRFEPRYDYSNHWDWYYSVAYCRPDSVCFHKERKDAYVISTWDFGLISPFDPRFRASIEEHRAYHNGTGTHMYEPTTDDHKLRPGGDFSCYRCSLCERYVEPCSDDAGELICKFCEVSGLVVFNPEDLDHIEQVRDFARTAGLSEQLERQLHYLADYGHRGNQCVLGKDFAPHSFSFILYRPGAKDARKFIFNVGLIFQGPSQYADGQLGKRHRLVLSYVMTITFMTCSNVIVGPCESPEVCDGPIYNGADDGKPTLGIVAKRGIGPLAESICFAFSGY